MTSESRDFAALCELARCSPDSAVIALGPSRKPGEEADWMQSRLLRAGHDIPRDEIVKAMTDYANRPKVAEHHVATIQL